MRNKKEIATEFVKQQILESIEESIQTGVYVTPWDVQIQREGIAFSYDTKKPYSLLNSFSLPHAGAYLTFAKFKELQKKNKEIKMKKGSTSFKIYFYGKTKKEELDKNPDGTVKKLPNGEDAKKVSEYWVFTESSVFHESCFENLPKIEIEKSETVDISPYEVCKNLGINIREDITMEYETRYEPETKSIILSSRDIDSFSIYHEMYHILTNLPNYKDVDFKEENLKADVFASLMLNFTNKNCKLESSYEYLTAWKEAILGNKVCMYSALSEANKVFEMSKSEILSKELKTA